MKNKKKFEFIDLSDDNFVENKVIPSISTKDSNKKYEQENISNNVIKKEYNINYEDIFLETQYNIERKKKKNILNLKPRSNLKSYNIAAKNLNKRENESLFNDEKIKEIITIKEKLDIKTNIYLKSSLVIKLKALEELTNESRSAIINKLLEIALKNIE